MSEKQIPQIVGNIEKGQQGMELLERGRVRPRQARYQAALRPDMNCTTHSKVLPDFLLAPIHRFWPRPCTFVPEVSELFRPPAVSSTSFLPTKATFRWVLREAVLREHRSFAVEDLIVDTELLESARNAGYATEVILISTEDPNLNASAAS